MKINKFIYVAVVGALFASCQSVETPMFSDKDAFVAFDNASTTIEENANKEIQIPVSLVASKALDASVNFDRLCRQECRQGGCELSSEKYVDDPDLYQHG